jgi:hypothetical protein
MLVLKPPGRGNWGALIVAIEGRRAGALLQKPGDRVQLLGREWRVAKVLP